MTQRFSRGQHTRNQVKQSQNIIRIEYKISDNKISSC